MQMKMQMKLNQQLIMTPQLQQAIKLLQLSHTELEELIEQTLVENPVLEEGMDIDSFPNRETPAAEENPETPEVASGTEDFESAREVEKEEIDQQDIDWQQYVEQVDQLGGYQSTRIRPGTGGDDEAPSLEATLAQSETLSDHLHWQMGMQDLLPLEFKIGVELIGNLEDDGYLVTSIREMLETRRDLHDEILNQLNEGLINCNLEVDESFFDLKYKPVKAVMPKKSKEVLPPVFDEDEEGAAQEKEAFPVNLDVCRFVEQVLRKIQGFDPNGVGARSLQECLLIQLRILGKTESLSYRIIEQDMNLLESKDLKKIARRQKQELDQVIDAYRLIMSLEPKPGRAFIANPSQHYIIPDVYIYQNQGKYKVALNANGIPRLRISSYYRDLCDSMEDDGSLTKEYIHEKIKAGQWLLKSIEQRQKTIFRVTKSILKFQMEFFEKGIHFLRPLVLKDVAEDIDVHESTVSRITTNKFVHTPQGIFELKYFFTSGIDQGEGEAVSSKRIKDMIQQMVQNEDPKTPYTDLQIADILHRRSGIKVARRTVAKYREALNILPSNKRKQLF